jgi:hypothetical protein
LHTAAAVVAVVDLVAEEIAAAAADLPMADLATDAVVDLVAEEIAAAAENTEDDHPSAPPVAFPDPIDSG